MTDFEKQVLKEAKIKYAAVVEAAIDGDDERAHSKEDDLRVFVIENILKVDDVLAGKLRNMALRTNKLAFYRWCA